MITVTVAVPTFRRNDDLLELVPMLRDAAAALEQRPGFAVRVLIVDNDPAGGAEVIVRSMGEGVDYVHEPVPGLSAVRSRAIAESGSSRLLAFIDDDGRPGPGWLTLLVDAWMIDEPAAVAGRVLESYESEPDAWLVAGGFFRRRSLPTRTVVPVAPAGNLLLDLDAVRSLGLDFDPRFGLTGGEDTLFTRQLSDSGGRIVWCDESHVIDQVPTNRMNRTWVLNRSFSHGNTWSLVERAMTAGRAARLRARARCAGGGAGRVVAGLGRYALGMLTRSVAGQAKGLRLAYRGAGMVYGALGRTVEEYAR
ncbi:glycosyltransferase [Terrabacter sp. Ter38]|uniref:glycosyltransferase family 2 protein n=1 Tax=Terrabacter sp. Ter38 TaxID=2926030 RepID=UPI00211935BC|nr:glycosyltransferase [Terrabacter sp. Ter38]